MKLWQPFFVSSPPSLISFQPNPPSKALTVKRGRLLSSLTKMGFVASRICTFHGGNHHAPSPDIAAAVVCGFDTAAAERKRLGICALLLLGEGDFRSLSLI